MEFLKIAIIAEDPALDELSGVSGVEWIRYEKPEDIQDPQGAEVLLYLKDDWKEKDLKKCGLPLILNSVTTPLSEAGWQSECIRINGWPGFLHRETWEISGQASPAIRKVLEQLGKRSLQVADEPGLVSARVISMIINEAYFALEQNVSTREEIDIAMKLGTNYPYGPFEWSRKIGLGRICQLLEKLSLTDEKYTPSTLLKTEATV